MQLKPTLRKATELGLCLVAITTLILAGCGGGGGGTAAGTSATVKATGVVYPIVVGLSYQTNSVSGVIAADGKYTYQGKENVTFSAGGIALATVPAAAQVTPIPLDNNVSSTNLLRLFKALDTDVNLSNGITLKPLATSSLTGIDLSSESSVSAVLSSLLPTAILPAVSDVQVTTTLAAAKTTALQNMGTFGSTYKAIIVPKGCNTLPQYPKNAVVNLTSQPNWVTGAISGTATLTLNDNSTVTLPINAASGTYTASGGTVAYSFVPSYGGKTRVLFIDFIACGRMVVRDNSQPNIPPVPSIGLTYSVTLPQGTPPASVYTFSNIPSGADTIVAMGSVDLDGMVVSQSWVSSKGTTGTGNTFSESFNYNEKGSITLTATDDEGATASKTWQFNSGGTAASTLTLAGSVNSSLAMNNDTFWNQGPVINTGTIFNAMLIDGTYPVIQSETLYARAWTTGVANTGLAPAAGVTQFNIAVYQDTVANRTYLDLAGGKDTSAYYLSGGSTAGFRCEFIASNLSPSCASAGINMNRTAGSISFTNTPMVIMVNGAAPSGSFTLNGTLSFTPF